MAWELRPSYEEDEDGRSLEVIGPVGHWKSAIASRVEGPRGTAISALGHCQ
jgi:hypothetical protein